MATLLQSSQVGVKNIFSSRWYAQLLHTWCKRMAAAILHTCLMTSCAARHMCTVLRVCIVLALLGGSLEPQQLHWITARYWSERHAASCIM